MCAALVPGGFSWIPLARMLVEVSAVATIGEASHRFWAHTNGSLWVQVRTDGWMIFLFVVPDAFDGSYCCVNHVTALVAAPALFSAELYISDRLLFPHIVKTSWSRSLVISFPLLFSLLPQIWILLAHFVHPFSHVLDGIPVVLRPRLLALNSVLAELQPWLPCLVNVLDLLLMIIVL